MPKVGIDVGAGEGGEVNQIATQPVCKAFTSDPGGHEAHANAFAFEYCPGGHFKQGCVGV